MVTSIQKEISGEKKMSIGRVIVMRGISGSGKSFYTRKHHPEAVVCSADDYFTEVLGEGKEYRFDPAKLPDAHSWCMQKFLRACTQDQAPVVVVDNTNTKIWELSGYVQVAGALGYDVSIVRMDTPVDVASGRNTHGVPAKAVQGMADRFEKCLPWWRETVVRGV